MLPAKEGAPRCPIIGRRTCGVEATLLSQIRGSGGGTWQAFRGGYESLIQSSVGSSAIEAAERSHGRKRLVQVAAAGQTSKRDLFAPHVHP